MSMLEGLFLHPLYCPWLIDNSGFWVFVVALNGQLLEAGL